MLISTRGRYALRIMLELAQYDQSPYMPLPLIAEKQGISEKYLESIVSLLVKGGLVEGVRGKGGGYRLCRPLKDYSAGEILRLTEGSLAPVSCLEGDAQCLPPCGPVPHPAHVDQAGGPHQQLSGQRHPGGPAGRPSGPGLSPPTPRRSSLRGRNFVQFPIDKVGFLSYLKNIPKSWG